MIQTRGRSATYVHRFVRRFLLRSKYNLLEPESGFYFSRSSRISSHIRAAPDEYIFFGHLTTLG